jgi:hypothetical protein
VVIVIAFTKFVTLVVDTTGFEAVHTVLEEEASQLLVGLLVV